MLAAVKQRMPTLRVGMAPVMRKFKSPRALCVVIMRKFEKPPDAFRASS